MPLDSFNSIWRRVLLRTPAAGSLLARDWVTNAFRRVAERRRWSWLVREGQFLVPVVYSTGTADLTHNSTTVTGTDTVWTEAMEGRQFRASTDAPVYTISARVSNTEITLDRVYGGPTATGLNYDIFQAYFSVPSDFHAFIVVVDTEQSVRLNHNSPPEHLESADPQRTNEGQPWLLAFHDYDTTPSPPLPRYELWPHVKEIYVVHFMYEVRATDLEDSGAELPRFIRGDMLLEMALAEAASWPGPSVDKPNPYFNLSVAARHDRSAERMIMESERQDDEVWMQDLRYGTWMSFPMAGSAAFAGDAWRQSHAVPVDYWL